MDKVVQKRTLVTRQKLIDASIEIINENGYEALRVEEVVKRAGVAKGTFFAHFKDKDALMDLLIGREISQHLDEIAQSPQPKKVGQIVDALMPMLSFMSCERYVFDVILRYSGAAAIEEIGEIARSFEKQVLVIEGWLDQTSFRTDIPARMQAEGMMAFYIQAISLKFCALHEDINTRDYLITYLKAWLKPKP